MEVASITVVAVVEIVPCDADRDVPYSVTVIDVPESVNPWGVPRSAVAVVLATCADRVVVLILAVVRFAAVVFFVFLPGRVGIIIGGIGGKVGITIGGTGGRGGSVGMKGSG